MFQNKTPQICSNCLFIDTGKNKHLHGSFLVSALYLGLGVIALGVPFFNIQYLSLFIGAIFVYLGLVSFKNYFKNPNKVCSKCKQRAMMPIYEPEAQKLIEENGFMVRDEVTKFCTNCHYKGMPKQIHSLKYSLLTIFLGIFGILCGLIFNPISLLGAFILIAAGIYGTFTNFRKPNTCPSCNQVAMIPIESEEAKSLIKQDHSESSNLSPDQTKAPST